MHCKSATYADVITTLAFYTCIECYESPHDMGTRAEQTRYELCSCHVDNLAGSFET